MKKEDREADIAERYPHFKSYKACQLNAFAVGSVTFAGVCGTSYFIYDALFKRFKVSVSNNMLLALPFVTGTVAAYVVSMRKALNCQNMWMAMEERHSALTPAHERLEERLRASNNNESAGS